MHKVSSWFSIRLSLGAVIAVLLAYTAVFAATEGTVRASQGCCGRSDCILTTNVDCSNEDDCNGYTCCYSGCI